MSRKLPTGPMGYAIDKENMPLLMANGLDPVKMLKAAEDAETPTFDASVNPMTLFDPLNQGRQGACQGHSLALIFTICYFLLTGRIVHFSRAAAYYLSQRYDGLRGDVGSTLSGGQKVATQHGLCLETDWPYPDRYDSREPASVAYPFKLVASQPTQDFELIEAALRMGLPVQDGIVWNSEMEQTVVENYTGRGAAGGHSTTLFTVANDLFKRINSWGDWDGDGCNENTRKALKQQVELRGNVHVIYAPAGMIYPDLEPVELPS